MVRKYSNKEYLNMRIKIGLVYFENKIYNR